MILEGLNTQQREAATHIDGPLLLLAGAGSGKTRALTARLAYLIQEVGIPADLILCLTFTNKASKEMHDRAMRMIGTSSSYPLLCTFHKFGLLFLKQYLSLLDRPSSFVLLDGDDVKKIVKSFKSLLPTSMIMGYISYYKNQVISPQEALSQAKSKEFQMIAELYEQYQYYLESKNLLDFDDLLYLTYLILQQNPKLIQTMSERYAYIMVDEYQDTNPLQYKILKSLTSIHQNLCVVGDEDQSIYGWRGADIRNILEFEKDFKQARVIKLEQNYRSTPQILAFANRLISHNTQRLGKTLRPTLEDGEEVEITQYGDESEEIAAITQKIWNLVQGGVGLDEIVILYRLNALSRKVEEGLNQARIPYRLIGSVRFYERSEVKDVLSYLRLMANIEDDFSLMRVINKPKRGLGKTSQERLQALANNQSIYKLFSQRPDAISPKTLKVLEDFFTLIAELKEAFHISIDRFVDLFDTKVPLMDEYLEHEREDRRANILELFGLLREFREKYRDASLQDFLNDLSLSSDSDLESKEQVSCMSMHLSKGLEFDYVFVIGCEEGFFPLERDGGNLEEERRLGYVAFTRAKKKLIVSSVRSRFYKGKRQMLEPSRFIRESLEGQSALSVVMTRNALVKHKVFGIGRIEEVMGSGNGAKARVNFGGNQRVILLNFLELAQ
ncbi:ATP-dependent helicase [Helicobacter pametensis]|uniref:ATP-dependent helicase n=1 Tax=Helicobacter pametensis TaxID=95149 RepID=UPI0004B353C3|nr:UvrD-helicase domain-containing protein [Helicobacter pametensis]